MISTALTKLKPMNKPKSPPTSDMNEIRDIFSLVTIFSANGSRINMVSVTMLFCAYMKTSSSNLSALTSLVPKAMSLFHLLNGQKSSFLFCKQKMNNSDHWTIINEASIVFSLMSWKIVNVRYIKGYVAHMLL